MPHLGQGGAMAIEAAYVLGQELQEIQHTNEIPAPLKAFEKRRMVRASIAQFLSRNGSDGWMGDASNNTHYWVDCHVVCQCRSTIDHKLPLQCELLVLAK
jgi:2-polyprenyl-6-methoxyphenol hydroxylase-like FAD-dependent oxidoreductase